MALQISPFGNNQFFTNAGKPAAGYQLFTYAGRSATKQTTYKDRDGIAEHTNPIILDANGFPPGPIYIDTTLSYKFVLALEFDTDPPSSPLQPVVDQISVGLETPTATTPEWTVGTTPTYISSTSFQVAGDQRTIYHAGRRLRLITGSGTLHASVVSSAFSTNTTVTVLMDSGTLDNSLSVVYYGFLGATGSSWPGGYSTGNNTTLVGSLVVPVTSSFNLITVGSVFPFAGSTAPPAGYLLCNGAAVSRTQFSALFGAISTVFGVGDGSTTFNLPNISNLVANVPYIIRYA